MTTAAFPARARTEAESELGSAVVSAVEAAEDAEGEARTLAVELARTMLTDKFRAALVENVLSRQLEGVRPLAGMQIPLLQEAVATFQQKVMGLLPLDSMVEMQAELLAQQYTHEEMSELLRFYRSPLGQKSLNLTSDMMATVKSRMLTEVPGVVGEFEALFPGLLQQLESEMPDVVKRIRGVMPALMHVLDGDFDKALTDPGVTKAVGSGVEAVILGGDVAGAVDAVEGVDAAIRGEKGWGEALGGKFGKALFDSDAEEPAESEKEKEEEKEGKSILPSLLLPL